MIGSKVMTQNAMQAKKSLSFAEQSVFVSSIPSSMILPLIISVEFFGNLATLATISKHYKR